MVTGVDDKTEIYSTSNDIKLVDKLKDVEVLLGSQPHQDGMGFYYMLHPIHLLGLTARLHCVYFL
jgi:hypothetical protein